MVADADARQDRRIPSETFRHQCLKYLLRQAIGGRSVALRSNAYEPSKAWALRRRLAAVSQKSLWLQQ